MGILKSALVGACMAVVLTASAQSVAQSGPTIGVSWASFQEERWKTDEAAMVAVIEAANGTYVKADAQQSNAKQLADIESLIARGVDALIVLAWDADAVLPGIEAALAEGIPVVGYDRLIEHPEVFYLTFDNKEVGRMQARAVFAAQPTGNYVFIKGYSADPNADFLHSGQLEVLQAAIDSGDINVVGEAYTDNWLPENAQRNMEQILTANNNNVDAVVASNDGTAGGVVAALTAQGMEGVVPVSGQDGDHAALNRVALGTQIVSVWKDARDLGQAAARIAIDLAEDTAPSAIPHAVRWDGGPKGTEVDAMFLAPVPVMSDNLDLVVEAGWIGRNVLCQGVPRGATAACN